MSASEESEPLISSGKTDGNSTKKNYSSLGGYVSTLDYSLYIEDNRFVLLERCRIVLTAYE